MYVELIYNYFFYLYEYNKNIILFKLLTKLGLAFISICLLVKNC